MWSSSMPCAQIQSFHQSRLVSVCQKHEPHLRLDGVQGVKPLPSTMRPNTTIAELLSSWQNTSLCLSPPPYTRNINDHRLALVFLTRHELYSFPIPLSKISIATYLLDDDAKTTFISWRYCVANQVMTPHYAAVTLQHSAKATEGCSRPCTVVIIGLNLYLW
jgi:hypothetical protein